MRVDVFKNNFHGFQEKEKQMDKRKKKVAAVAGGSGEGAPITAAPVSIMGGDKKRKKKPEALVSANYILANILSPLLMF